MNFRVGFGYDVHHVVDKDLWLGGIKIPHEKGGLGHSDADVLIHMYVMHYLVPLIWEILVLISLIIHKNIKILIVRYCLERSS